MDRNEENKALTEMYAKWFKVLETKKDSFDFFGARYSNPHLLDVPYNWDSSKTRIMFIGEELRGGWGKDLLDSHDIEGLQAKYRCFLYSQIDGLGANSPEDYVEHDKEKRSQFWKIIRRFDKDGVGIMWNNCDKFCVRKGRGRLRKKERIVLHENCSVLREEIKLLKPTHLVFLGWYGESLKTTLGESAIDKINNMYYKQNKRIFQLEKEDCLNIPNFFSNHPRGVLLSGKSYDKYETEIRKYLGL